MSKLNTGRLALRTMLPVTKKCRFYCCAFSQWVNVHWRCKSAVNIILTWRLLWFWVLMWAKRHHCDKLEVVQKSNF